MVAVGLLSGAVMDGVARVLDPRIRSIGPHLGGVCCPGGVPRIGREARCKGKAPLQHNTGRIGVDCRWECFS